MIISNNLKKNIYLSLTEDSSFDELTTMNMSDTHKFIKIFKQSRSFFLLKRALDAMKDFSKKSQIVNSVSKTAAMHSLQTLMIISEAKKISKLFSDIDFVFLKGTHLINSFYKDPALRPSRDIDILVREDEIDRAIQILITKGYKFKSFLNLYGSNQSNSYKYEIPPLISKDGITIEMHYKIENSYEPCKFRESFLSSKTEDNFLSTENLILHLIYHAIKKQGPDIGLIFIQDIVKIFSSDKQINYRNLIYLSDKYDLKKDLFLTLHSINNNIEIPKIKDFLKSNRYIIDDKVIKEFELILIYNPLDSLDYSIMKLLNKFRFSKIHQAYAKKDFSYPINIKLHNRFFYILYRAIFHLIKVISFSMKVIFWPEFRKSLQSNLFIYKYLYKK